MKALVWVLLIGGSWAILAVLFMWTWEVIYALS
jgi:hypothetical protein